MSATLAVEITLACRACGGVVPVNALAPQVACPSCKRAIALAASTWPVVLGPAMAALAGLAENDERASEVTTEAGTFRVAYRRADAACGACGAKLVMDDGARGHLFCVGCGARVLVRAGAFGAMLVVGEEAERAAERETITVPCGGCGAPIHVDGTSRAVHCAFCGASSHVPDGAWERLHPAARVRRLYLVCEARDAPARAASWRAIGDVTLDEHGNLYATGTLDDTPDAALFSLTPDFALRWTQRNLRGLSPRGARVLLAPGGRVAAWEPGKPALAFFDAETGAARGGYPGAACPVHLERCASLAVDADGTLLAVVRGKPWGGMPEHALLVRFTEAGELRDTWPGCPPPPVPEIGQAIPRLRDLASQPTCVQGAPDALCTADGWTLLFQREMLSARIDVRAGGLSREDAVFVARAAKDGATDVVRLFPAEGEVRLAPAARGELWLLDDRALARFDRAGRSVVRLERGAVVGAERAVAVAPDGTAVLLGDGGKARRIAPDGRLVFVREG